MRKKAILILLLIPFIVAILAFVEVRNKIKEVEQDITNIVFNYDNNEAFTLDEGKILLEASAIYDSSLPLAEGNNLIWSSSNLEVCEVKKEGNNYYLYLNKVGESLITCQNAKGTVSKSFMVTILSSDGGVLLNLERGFSGQGIASNYNVGLYDLDYSATSPKDYQLVNREEVFTIELINMNTNIADLKVETSSNVEVNLTTKTITLLAPGMASIKIYDQLNEEGAGNLSFNVIDGVNIYSYNDLLLATNFSKESLKIVQRVNLESYQNTYNTDGSLKQADTVLFGNYNNGSYNFTNEVYRFTTTFNHQFIDSWNQVAEKVSTTVVAGIHVTADYYGNGFTINMHNLCYPSDTQEITVGGSNVMIPLLKATDLFRGPLVYLSLGAPKTNSSLGLANYTYAIYALYGQDNIGVYVEGDNITLDDVHFKNCDFGNNFYNLEYSGTVLELAGKNITVKNSVIENGRNVIRSFSSQVSITNCLLQNGMEYLVKTGSNEGVKVDLTKRIYYEINGSNYSSIVSDYLKPSDVMTKNYQADSILTNAALLNTPGGAFFGFSEPIYTKDEVIKFNEIIKDALSSEDSLYDFNGNKKYNNYLTITDTLFANSGISAILLDTLANGSYLETNITSLFNLLLGSYIPQYPKNMAYTSYPTKLDLVGNNAFYDWKDIAKIDFSSLLFQDIAGLILAHGGVGSVEVTDDNYLPLRKLISMETDYHLEDGMTTYVNLPIMKMGGGPNLSDVYYEQGLLTSFSADPYLYALDLSTEMVDDFMTNNQAKRETMLIAMTRASSNVLGFEEYTFYSLDVSKHYWYKENPSITILRENND